ncbi:MAG TPA: NAD(P)/FAD-dependent oxidoreductase [Gammaproteobacteria bacterium]|nr:ferredoxin--NADP(+) reductase [Gammaproteobacteria bacterium]MBQ08325.1 ferredoxin--NADP(+) reductase [Gammaproteobacteria bacterium]HJN01025.1 NAD(P)/FAD-dependent oxidoreductase [Gammaproteobacteria bacterium]|tara:strand:+ start:1958 stop:3010 length:1053 start_codon:yes stop_codon:yes gene_type:complete
MPNENIETDALIIGAGPCGLFQVFELGLLGIESVVIDSLPSKGGQCSELYPDKPIYDIPGIPVCTGEELIENLSKQIEPFSPHLILGDEVTELERKDGSFDIKTQKGKSISAKTVFIAGGVGSFQPRKIRIKGIDEHENKWLHYRVKDKNAFHGKKIIIAGGGDSALDWAIDYAESSDHIENGGTVSLIHRRDEYRGAVSSIQTINSLAKSKRINLYENTKISGFDSNGANSFMLNIQSNGSEQTIEGDVLLVFYGLSPKLGPIAEWGLDITKKSIAVNTESYQTNIPGVFAIGDISDYPGKKKLILSGFHEAALAAFAAKAIITPGKKVNLQYTTTSPLLKERLGVNDN